MERMPPQQQHPTGGAQAQGPPPRRLSEPAKFLPVAFLVCTILVLYLIYVLTHCLSLLQVDVEYQHQDDTMKRRGLVQLAVFHYVTILLVICYARCVLESPGEIPRDDPRWIHVPSQDRSLAGGVVALNLQEMKKSGDRRHCKWCSRFKPDRCHHCRVCRRCILKMDHHCPWIYNCVGFKNYKFFFLLLFYSCVDTHFIVWTMSESVRRSVESQAPFMTMFLHVFGVTLAFWMGLILTLFFGFHVWLVSRAMTIIEFCEKSTSQPGPQGRDGLSSAYDQGCLENVRAALGANPLLWLLPVCPPSGDGLAFATNESASLLSLQQRGQKPNGSAKAHDVQKGRQGSDGPEEAERLRDRLGPAQYR